MKHSTRFLSGITLGVAALASMQAQGFAATPSLWQTLAPYLSHAKAQAQTPTEAANILNNAAFARGEESWDVPGERAETSLVDGPPGRNLRALRIQANPEKETRAWDIALRQKLEVPFAAGANLKMTVWMRSPQSVSAGVFVEAGAPDYSKSLAQTIALTTEWKQYTLEGRVLGATKSGDLTLTFHLGAARGTIDIADVVLSDLSAPPQSVVRSNATPEKPISLLQNGDFSQDFANNWNGFAAPGAQSTVTGAPFVLDNPANVGGAKNGIRLNLTPPAGVEPWNMRIGQKINANIGRDDAIYARVWMRSPESVRAFVVAELATEPHTKFIRETVKLTPQWKEYRFVGYAPRTFAPGEAQFNIFLGFDKGTLEIANPRLENFGKAPRSQFDVTVDFGDWNKDDSWRAPALKRIEQIRKGDVQIRVLDAAGKSVPNAQVQIEQKQHFFKWGTAGNAARLLDTSSDNNRKYQENVKRLFNTWVFENDHKWPASDTPAALDKIDAAVNWLRDNGIKNIRGHNVVWGSDKYLPTRVQNLDKNATLAALRERAATIGARYAGKVYVWDVVNEAADNTSLWEKIGWENFANVYQWTRDADPKALLAYNDYHAFNSPEGAKFKLEMQRIQQLIDAKVPFDVIGEQAHLGTPLISMKTLLERTDLLAKFGKRLEITEFDVGLQDDRVNGEYTRDFLIAMFSHPQVDAFLMWGFWEGAHWRANDGGAMFRKDWTPRPAAVIYEDLVWNQWRTRLNAQSDAQGNLQNRAFYGTHQITVSKDGKSATQQIELVPNGVKNWTVILK